MVGGVGAMKTIGRERFGRDGVHQKMTKYLSETSNFIEKMPKQFICQGVRIEMRDW